MENYKLIIDGKEVTGVPGQTILQVAEENGIKIPTLCYDERTEIYGSCGLCVVEVEGNPKLCKACATKIADGMSVKTRTERVLALRKMNLELLLSNHRGDCRPPCMLNCPAETDCQGYVGLIANGEYEQAVKLIKEKLPLPASIGRVCPHPCEDNCRRQLADQPVSIAWLKRFAADTDLFGEDPFMPEIKEDTGKKVAVIGGGPYGLSVAYFLRTMGHQVTIFEAMPKLGGMLRYGIPEYRLPKKVLDEEIDLIARMGVVLKPNTKIGEDITFDEIYKSFDAVAVGIGAWKSTPVGCKGDDAKGVIGGIDLLRQVVKGEPTEMGKVVAVVGGGNTAMDACRTAIRLGAEKVYNLYRRTKDEMPAEQVEIEEAEEEGVIFKTLVSPLEIISDQTGHVKQIVLQVMELGEPGPDGRRKPVAVEGKTETLDVDTVIAAIGQAVSSEAFEGIDKTRKSGIKYDPDTFRTSMKGVFAGGDCGNDKISIAIAAIGDAGKTARIIDRYLYGEDIAYHEEFTVKRTDLTFASFEDRERKTRPDMSHLSPEERKHNFEEIVKGYTPEQAREEASRCLECGCQDYFECKLIDYAHQSGIQEIRFPYESECPEWEDDHAFVVRDDHKCILCGLCVRVCEEVVGAGALGFVHRGFQTVVLPALEKPLRDSGCISCGRCIDVCPTGALQERAHGHKAVPLDTDKTETTCAFCGAGCHLEAETKGNTIVRVKGDPKQAENAGIICGMGKFGFDMSLGEDQMKEALVRKAGRLEAASYEETIKAAAEAIRKAGYDKTAFALSPRMTNEEAAAVKGLAEAMGACCFSYDSMESGLALVAGKDASTANGADLDKADTLVAYGPVLSLAFRAKLRLAKKRGAKVIAVMPEDMMDQDTGFATKVYQVANDTLFLQGAVKAAAEKGGSDLAGYPALMESLKDVAVTEEARELALAYQKGEAVVSLLPQGTLTKEGAVLIADLAALTGQLSGEGKGIIQIRKKNNTQGLVELGVTEGAQAAAGKKAVLVFGEDPADLQADQDAYVLVSDVYRTAACEKADGVIPATWFVSAEGSFTDSMGNHNPVKALVKEEGYSPAQIARDLAEALGLGTIQPAKAKPSCEGAEAVKLQPAGKSAFVEMRPVADDLMRKMKERLANA